MTKVNKSKKALKTNAAPNSLNRGEMQWLDCKICGIDGQYVAGDIKAVTCGRCTVGLTDPPAEKVKPLEKRPRGWHLMKTYISPSGEVFHRGVSTNEVSSKSKR
jgi:hypothetical protein